MFALGNVFVDFFRQRPTEKEAREAAFQVRTVELDFGRVTDLSPENIEASLVKIQKVMKRHLFSSLVQATCCHALSNMAISQNPHFIHQVARLRINRSLEKAMQQHALDAKVNWLACSAVWNLCRSPELRDLCGVRTAGVLLKVLEKFNGNIRVVDTALGAQAGSRSRPPHLQAGWPPRAGRAALRRPTRAW